MARDRLAQRLASQGTPYRRYGPQYRGSMRAASSGSSWDDTLATTSFFGVDERVSPMNAKAEQQRSVAVIDVPFVAIARA